MANGHCGITDARPATGGESAAVTEHPAAQHRVEDDKDFNSMVPGPDPSPPERDFAADPEGYKEAARQQAQQRRKAIPAAERAALSARICDQALERIAFPAGACVSAYWPIGDEVDPRALMTSLYPRGHKIVLPVVVSAGQPLIFRVWAPGDSLEPAGFGTWVPSPDRPTVQPDVLFVPLLAFDAAGYRLGYGGGFYDRTLQKLRAQKTVRAIGIAFAAQEIPWVPRDCHDQMLDAVLTEHDLQPVS